MTEPYTIFGVRVVPLQPGEWRFHWRLIRMWRFTYVVDRYPEGTVYRAWCGCLFAKLRVCQEKAE